MASPLHDPDRRTWSIAVKFARQYDGGTRFSSFHWSPPAKDWPELVRAAALDLRDAIDRSLSAKGTER